MATRTGLRLVIYTSGGLLLSLARFVSMPADITTLAFDPAHLSDADGVVLVASLNQQFAPETAHSASPVLR